MNALLLVNVMFAAGPSRANLLDGPITTLILEGKSDACRRVLGSLGTSARRRFGLPLHQVSIRAFLSKDVYEDFAQWSPGEKSDFVECMSDLGLPWNLNDVEIAMFLDHPYHPLFRNLNDVDLPKGFGALSLGKTYRLYHVIDVVRALRQWEPILRRRNVDALRDFTEQQLGQPLASLPVGSDGRLIAPFLPPRQPASGNVAAVMERPFVAVVTERLYDHYRTRAGDHPVMKDLNELMNARGDRPTDEMPTRYFMTASFHKLIRSWSKDRRRQFRDLMARLNLPIDLDPHEMDAFALDPLDTLYAPVKSVPGLAGLVTKNSQIYFVIDAVKALRSPVPHPFAAAQIEVKRAALEKFLERPLGLAAPPNTGAQSPSTPPMPNVVDCQKVLRGVSDEDFMSEFYRRLAEGRWR